MRDHTENEARFNWSICVAHLSLLNGKDEEEVMIVVLNLADL